MPLCAGTQAVSGWGTTPPPFPAGGEVLGGAGGEDEEAGKVLPAAGATSTLHRHEAARPATPRRTANTLRLCAPLPRPSTTAGELQGEKRAPSIEHSNRASAA